MSPTLVRANRNYLLRHPWQLGLAILGITLGVAVVVAVDLAKDSAQRAFARSTEVVVGKATHRIIGNNRGLDESLYTRLRVDSGINPIAPVIEGHVKVDSNPQRTLKVLGIDPIAEDAFRQDWRIDTRVLSANEDRALSPLRLISDPGAMLVSSATAKRLGIEPGDTLDIIAGTTKAKLSLLGVLASANNPRQSGLEDLVIVDVSTAQEVLNMTRRLSHIDLIVEKGAAGASRLETVKHQIPPSAQLIPAGTRERSVQQMTWAFHTNLTALALLALMVGAFLIYNTISFMVVQRRTLIGNLRTLGVTRGQVFRLVLKEAIVIGTVGSVCGILVGSGLAQILLGLVSRTINTLYFSLSVTELSYSWIAFGKALILGLGATLAAATIPALEATRVTPRLALTRSALEQRSRTLTTGAAFVGIAAAIVGGAIILWSGTNLVAGITGLFFVVFGCTLTSPALTVGIVGLLSRLLGRRFGLIAQLSVRRVTVSLSRTAVAITALVLAVATTVGIGAMIGSLRLSVADWLDQILRADFYVSTLEPAASGGDTSLQYEFAERLAALPDVASISAIRRIEIQSDKGPFQLIAYRLAPKSYAGFRFIEGERDAVWPAFEQRGAVIVSEPFAYHHGLDVGSTIRLPTDLGERSFSIAGIYRSYSSDRGVVAIHKSTFDRYWDAPGYSAIGLYTRPGTDLDTLREQIINTAAGNMIEVSASKDIRETSLAVFDQTFTITKVLRAVAGFIAFAGILGALMALQLERTREMGVLRALGVTPRQLRLTIVSETGLMGLVAGLLAIPVGCVMAALLIFVINRRAFGWSMQFHIEPVVLMQGLLLALLASLLAGAYPAIKMASIRPVEALRTE